MVGHAAQNAVIPYLPLHVGASPVVLSRFSLPLLSLEFQANWHQHILRL